MSTSDIENNDITPPETARVRGWLRRAVGFAAASCITALFGALYELFSHGVYSYSMLYAFGYMLVGGVVPSLVMACLGRECRRGAAFELYVFALSCATVGSLVGGVFEIFGSSSRLLPLFYVLSALSAFASAVLWLIRRFSLRHCDGQ